MTPQAKAQSIVAEYERWTGGKILSISARYRHPRGVHVVEIKGTAGDYDEQVAWPELIDVVGELQRIIKP